MSANQLQTTVTAKVWQSIAQSGIDISGIPREDMNKLVDLVVDAALDGVDTQLETLVKNQNQAVQQANSTPQAATATNIDEDEEVVLWEGRPFMSLTVNYIITNERIRIIEGILGKDYKDIELVRVQHFDFKQSMTERTLNLGDVHIVSHDPHNPEITLENVKKPKDVHETLRRAVIKAREKYRLSYREEM